MTDEDKTSDRRSLLRRGGIVGLSLVGLSGVASAGDEKNKGKKRGHKPKKKRGKGKGHEKGKGKKRGHKPKKKRDKGKGHEKGKGKNKGHKRKKKRGKK